ncbi:MAG: SRPBCC family protein [Acidimicrobiia bacterium]|nr:SRPBCC family protein [Acidimicrobiia bacterium]
MPRISKTVTIDRPPAEVFEYLANFETTAEWDPGITTATKTSRGPIGVGSTFDLIATFRGRTIPVTYEITEYDPPSRFVIVGRNKQFVGTDDIRVSADGPGTRVDYTADFRMQGIARLFEPFMGGIFERLSVEAMDGLKKTLG